MLNSSTAQSIKDQQDGPGAEAWFWGLSWPASLKSGALCLHLKPQYPPGAGSYLPLRFPSYWPPPADAEGPWGQTFSPPDSGEVDVGFQRCERAALMVSDEIMRYLSGVKQFSSSDDTGLIELHQRRASLLRCCRFMVGGCSKLSLLKWAQQCYTRAFIQGVW